MIRLLLLLLAVLSPLPAMAQERPAQTFERALDLVHAYSGSGPELRQAMDMADRLSRAAPKSGYAQVLQAEALSTWTLTEEGLPISVRYEVISLAEEALKLNPKLAHAHVPKARALVRSSLFVQANVSIDAALALEPRLTGALFLRAEMFRRQRAVADANRWYQAFIDSTTSKSRKSNGYAWIADMYQDASWYDDANREQHIASARAAYESMLQLEPSGAWRNVNYAVFLNDYAADFDAAEQYATKALGMMEFPMARYHLAAARYQKLWVTSDGMSTNAVRQAAANIAQSTGISLKDAVNFDSFSRRLARRLSLLLQVVETP